MLVNELMINIDPRTAVALALACVAISGVLGYVVAGGLGWGVIGAAIGAFVPSLVIRHLEQKRRERLASL